MTSLPELGEQPLSDGGFHFQQLKIITSKNWVDVSQGTRGTLGELEGVDSEVEAQNRTDARAASAPLRSSDVISLPETLASTTHKTLPR